MSSIKLFCVAACIGVSFIASQAFADCSADQEVDLAKRTTAAVSDSLASDAPVQDKKVMRIYDCDSDSGDYHATYRYSYLNGSDVKTVSGEVAVGKDGKTSLDKSKNDVAYQDGDYTETYRGRYNYRGH